MKTELRHVDGRVIFECEADSLREACEKAIRAGKLFSRAYLGDAYLRDADLRDVDLRGADLRRADLRRADLRRAYLRDAYLRGADLGDADLRGADLRRADLGGADLGDADLRGADLSDAYLSGAKVRGTKFDLEGVPIIRDIHKAVYAAASQPGALEMSDWHTCDTTHCRGGWTIALAGEAGRELEKNLRTSVAAALIYIASDPKLERVPDFHVSNLDALADMKRMAEM